MSSSSESDNNNNNGQAEDIDSLINKLNQSFISRLKEKESTIAPRTRNQHEIASRIQNQLQAVRIYDDFELQDKALQQIPVKKLHEEANARLEEDNSKNFHEELLKVLLKWFKSEYFTWVNQLECEKCKTKETRSLGYLQPTQDEVEYGAHRVEGYQCPNCKVIMRFPRYNHPIKLMETRKGRCGEWANVFALFTKAMGFESRYVLDFTDHVWTEVYFEYSKRWINCDSCEGEVSFDQPLMYEEGWGKKLNYIFSFGTRQVVDVMRRYSKDPEIYSRRKTVNELWLRAFLNKVNSSLLSTCSPEERRVKEEMLQSELNSLGKGPLNKALEGTHGRISGSIEWKTSRGEIGKSPQS